MGSPTSESCRLTDENQHQVRLTHSFEILQSEVSQSEFESLMAYNPSGFKSCGGDCPVDRVTWNEAALYCNARSKKTGLAECYTCTGQQDQAVCTEATAYLNGQIYACPGYRLPTEAEWEYAYRAGATSPYYHGPNDPGQCNSCTTKDTNADMIAWYCANAGDAVHSSGQKTATGWGLRDMAGNVAEWCHDGYKVGLSSSPVTDFCFCPATSVDRVIRGGAYDSLPRMVRAAYRSFAPAANRRDGLGLRCARTLTP